ncbi:unnamed protein product [Cyprideis torosa]|uniref:IMP dehydrogenase n=1 Tax=Cyprideis torosa TaxID=163714 RepID=A0A7R8WIL0_9CRUS|nr:unnamed protein product [Cyprideis torosa]CAG0900907.1 unnamed protein product [Cyprideis torosa]
MTYLCIAKEHMSLQNKIIQEGLTFDDILLIPSYSEVLPSEVSLKTRLSDRIQLSIPLISAAMDTVTEAGLAISLARQGGLGFIHKNFDIETQTGEVDKVKRSENGMISDPITLSPDQKLYDAGELMKRYHISGLPVIDKNKNLLGILTNRDIRYQNDMSQNVVDVMTKDDLVTSNINTSGLFAGTEEAPGEEVIFQGRKFKTYQGMGSLSAMKRGSKDRYFQAEEKEAKKLVPEGIEGRVPFKGSLEEVVYQLCGGVRSGMGYCGAKDLDELYKKAKFVRVTSAGLREAHPHDVVITKSAPNYSD